MVYTKEEFKAKVTDIQAQSWYKNPIGFGIARVDRGQLNADKILQATYPVVNWNENFGSAAIFMDAFKSSGVEIDTSASEAVLDISDEFLTNCIELFRPYIPEAKGEDHKNVQLISNLSSLPRELGLTANDFKVVFIFEDANPSSVESAYLKLYALSNGKAELRNINLNGAFGLLHNVAWSGNTPIELDWLRANELTLKLTGKYPQIDMVDKFPRFLSHVIPADNTRILDTSKVRFGAQLAAGTTVMPGASYINFNAGTLGPVMVEGRISSSAIVGSGSDVGGGASILGVLSGTDGEPITIGENCMLGAMSSTGMSLGDGCFVEMGTVVHESMPFFIEKKQLELINSVNKGCEISEDGKTLVQITYIDKNGNSVEKSGYYFMGKEIMSRKGIQFRDDKLAGMMIAFRSKKEVKLNEDLH
ncbi:MAG: tetrahydrodipicolinate N-succinyltransferase N-terminal domain-containing protein [Campylobacterota bacterium]|nr:tetrahydrodipicolinate N-succinyltransferase N-terminal domain-containing protein [Campylobacterota bacterium]